MSAAHCARAFEGEAAKIIPNNIPTDNSTEKQGNLPNVHIKLLVFICRLLAESGEYQSNRTPSTTLR